MKHKLHFFFTAFFCTLSVVAMFGGFLLADANTRTTGLRDNEPFFTVTRTAPLVCEVQLLGERFALPLAELNKSVYAVQRFFCFAPPSIRLLLRIGAASL